MPLFGFFLALILPWHVSAGEYLGTDVLCAVRVIIFCGENNCCLVAVFGFVLAWFLPLFSMYGYI